MFFEPNHNPLFYDFLYDFTVVTIYHPSFEIKLFFFQRIAATAAESLGCFFSEVPIDTFPNSNFEHFDFNTKEDY
jgi:hypothetical protein